LSIREDLLIPGISLSGFGYEDYPDSREYQPDFWVDVRDQFWISESRHFEFPFGSDTLILYINGRMFRQPMFWRRSYCLLFIYLEERILEALQAVRLMYAWPRVHSTILWLKSRSSLAAADHISLLLLLFIGKLSAGVKHLEKSSELIRSLIVYCYCM